MACSLALAPLLHRLALTKHHWVRQVEHVLTLVTLQVQKSLIDLFHMLDHLTPVLAC